MLREEDVAWQGLQTSLLIRFAEALLPLLFGTRIPGHTTRAPPVGFELATNGIQIYVIVNLDKTSLSYEIYAKGPTDRRRSCHMTLILAPLGGEKRRERKRGRWMQRAARRENNGG